MVALVAQEVKDEAAVALDAAFHGLGIHGGLVGAVVVGRGHHGGLHHLVHVVDFGEKLICFFFLCPLCLGRREKNLPFSGRKTGWTDRD